MSSASSHKSDNTQPSNHTASVGVHTNRTGVNSPVDTGVDSPSSCPRPSSKEKVASDSNHTGVNSTVDSGVDSPSSHLRPPSKEKVAPGKDHQTLPIPKFNFPGVDGNPKIYHPSSEVMASGVATMDTNNDDNQKIAHKKKTDINVGVNTSSHGVNTSKSGVNTYAGVSTYSSSSNHQQPWGNHPNDPRNYASLRSGLDHSI